MAIWLSVLSRTIRKHLHEIELPYVMMLQTAAANWDLYTYEKQWLLLRCMSPYTFHLCNVDYQIQYWVKLEEWKAAWNQMGVDVMYLLLLTLFGFILSIGRNVEFISCRVLSQRKDKFSLHEISNGKETNLNFVIVVDFNKREKTVFSIKYLPSILRSKEVIILYWKNSSSFGSIPT